MKFFRPYIWSLQWRLIAVTVTFTLTYLYFGDLREAGIFTLIHQIVMYFGHAWWLQRFNT